MTAIVVQVDKATMLPMAALPLVTTGLQVPETWTLTGAQNGAYHCRSLNCSCCRVVLHTRAHLERDVKEGAMGSLLCCNLFPCIFRHLAQCKAQVNACLLLKPACQSRTSASVSFRPFMDAAVTTHNSNLMCSGLTLGTGRKQGLFADLGCCNNE